MTKIIYKKKKVPVHGAHHGGAWKVAYADFVTAMMAFFLVMWILGLSEDTRKAISGYFADPGLFSFNTGKALPIEMLGKTKYYSNSTEESQALETQVAAQRERERLGQAGAEIQESLRRLAVDDKEVKQLLQSVQVSVTPDGLRIELLEGEDRGFFDIGGARPNQAAQKILASLAPTFGKMGETLRIEGHTDARPFPKENKRKYGNWELSADRANAARRILVDAGVAVSQIESVVGFAERRPRNEDPLHISNRRVTILVQKEETK